MFTLFILGNRYQLVNLFNTFFGILKFSKIMKKEETF